MILYQNRSRDFTGSLYQFPLYRHDGTPFILQPLDQVRFKVGQAPDVLLLDLISGSPTANASFVQITSFGSLGPPATPAMYQIQIGQADIATVTPGAYDGEVSVLVAASGLTDMAEQGVVHVIQTLGGRI